MLSDSNDTEFANKRAIYFDIIVPKRLGKLSALKTEQGRLPNFIDPTLKAEKICLSFD